MQEESGRMKMLDEEQVLNATPTQLPKIIREGMYFRIKHTYFKITEIDTEGIIAKGVSRREYFDNRDKIKPVL